MRRFLQLGFLGLLMASQLHAAEIANLRNGFSIRHEHHEIVGDTTRLYMSAEPAADTSMCPPPRSRALSRRRRSRKQCTSQAKASGLERPSSAQASTRSQVDADFIASVIRAESGNNPHAVSRKGAQGLMQLMPGTASKLGVKNSFDPAENVDGGVRYLRELLLLYNNDMVKALAAYNAGPQRVAAVQGRAAVPRDACLRGAHHQRLQPQEAGPAQAASRSHRCKRGCGQARDCAKRCRSRSGHRIAPV